MALPWCEHLRCCSNIKARYSLLVFINLKDKTVQHAHCMTQLTCPVGLLSVSKEVLGGSTPIRQRTCHNVQHAGVYTDLLINAHYNYNLSGMIYLSLTILGL